MAFIFGHILQPHVHVASFTGVKYVQSVLKRLAHFWLTFYILFTTQLVRIRILVSTLPLPAKCPSQTQKVNKINSSVLPGWVTIQ